MTPAIRLETERLVLRIPLASDLDWLLAHLNSAAVMRHLGGTRTADAVAAGWERNMAGFSRGGVGFWTVTIKVSGELVGKCGLNLIETEQAPAALQGMPEVGWSLAEGWWGQGIAAEAARAVLQYGFETRRFPAIHAQTSDSNAASTRLMSRLGFKRLAALDYVDPDYPAEDNPTTVYGLSAADWAR